MADEDVSQIILNIDSPGGEVAGAFDLADLIYQARGTKPILAIANESALSAAYLIASAADKVYLTRTASVGSVGVMALHVDQSKAEEKIGLKYTAIYAGARKNDFSPHCPLSDEAFAAATEKVNATYDLFVKTVARNRGISRRCSPENRGRDLHRRRCRAHRPGRQHIIFQSSIKRHSNGT